MIPHLSSVDEIREVGDGAFEYLCKLSIVTFISFLDYFFGLYAVYFPASTHLYSCLSLSPPLILPSPNPNPTPPSPTTSSKMSVSGWSETDEGMLPIRRLVVKKTI